MNNLIMDLVWVAVEEISVIIQYPDNTAMIFVKEEIWEWLDK